MKRNMLAAFCCIIIISSCRNYKEQPFVFILFDVSESMNNESVRSQYRDESDRIIERLSSGGTLWADIISENSLADANVPVRATFNGYSFITDNKIKYNELMKSEKEKTIKDISALFKNQTSPKTDIFNSLLFAEKVFISDDAAKTNDKRLLIFSDMIEDSDMINFAKNEVDDRFFEEIVSRQENSKTLPRLDGVKVWVVGGYNSSKTKLSSRKLQQIEKFWIKYMKKCGAELDSRNYAPTVLNF